MVSCMYYQAVEGHVDSLPHVSKGLTKLCFILYQRLEATIKIHLHLHMLSFSKV
jgi:hypothetical protein